MIAEKDSFEKFCKDFHRGASLEGETHSDPQYPHLNGQWIYHNWDVQSAWATWQARASVQPAGVGVPEGVREALYEVAHQLQSAARAKTKAVSTTLMAPHRKYELKDAQSASAFAADRLIEMADALAAAPHPVSGEQKPIGKVISEEEMGIGYDRKAGPVVWFGQPSPGFIYSAPPAVQDVAGLVEALEEARVSGRMRR